MDPSSIFTTGGPVVAALWVIYTLIKDKDKIIQNNIEVLVRLENILHKIDDTVSKIAQEGEQERVDEIRRRAESLDRREADIFEAERVNRKKK